MQPNLYFNYIFTFLIHLTFIVSSLSVQAQGRIEGNLLDEVGTPLVGGTILIAPHNLGSISDQDGFFEIEDVPPGTHTLIATYLGYTSLEQEVQVQANELTKIVFQFSEGDMELQTVEILGRGGTTLEGFL